MSIEQLKGKTLKAIKQDKSGESGDTLYFETTEGVTYRMYHGQDCCEDVHIDDIAGELQDLIGTPIELAEEISECITPDEDSYDDRVTWTFYKLATIKGSVTIRWYGSSNGYYSESVDFERVN